VAAGAKGPTRWAKSNGIPSRKEVSTTCAESKILVGRVRS